ncbi:HD domain-containing protein [Pseudodesulfovibrio sp. zrk46]|uniref:HD domain-containing protein n=1 Tax=Pseudodesulfovibrio sp. zrk46 TaxID=2725288 RepID=UPI0014498500|nr:HD domain-containing protein [Pseudodesulfovibrio sp. zrk46]QJB56096.1 HD domain-containing protein [Pseudodesulfovibrio sp. zrk46]
MKKERLYDFVDPADADCVRREVLGVVREFHPEYDGTLFDRVFRDIERLFFGMYPGYRASNTKYHNFEHTCSVVLAMSRLIYGAMCEGHEYSERAITRGLLSALYHDVGLIQTEDDETGTGAKYTVGHEERSIQFMRENLGDVLSDDSIEDIADCIRCTILMMPPSKIAFRTTTMRYMGYFLGSADLLAQIADRYYLEKLLLLFEEFKEAKLPGYDTAFDLLLKTRNFYQEVARKRLDNDLGKVDKYMGAYFNSRWGIDRDLYEEAINNNLNYLDSILSGCNDDLDCFMKSLRRGGFALEAMK